MANNIIDSIQLSGTIYTLSAQTSGGGVPESTFSAYTAATDSRLSEDEEVTAAALNTLNDAVSGKQDTLIAGDNITISGNVISASGGGSITIDSGITSGSTNAVENGAIWSATTYNKEVTLEFDNSSGGIKYSTNFPSGCTTVKVTVPNGNVTILFLSGSTNYQVGNVYIQKYGSTPSVSLNFTDASYTIENNDVIITYPSSKCIDKLSLSTSNSITVKAVVEGAFVNENTYMMSEVDGKIKALDDKKLDATAYTPTVVDSQLNAASTNPVQNQALYDELVIEGAEEETTLIFTGTPPNYKSTNYPSGCTKVKITSPSNSTIRYYFYSSQGASIGYVHIFKYGSISVSLAFDGASYSIDGGDVIITYPTVTNVGYIAPDAADVSSITVKAATTQTTHLIDQVTANTASIATKQDILSAGTGIDITDNVISVTGGGGVPESTFSAYTAATDSRLSEDEEVTAAGLNALNDKIDSISGANAIEVTQAEYDALVTGGTVDPNAFYIITDATEVDISQYWTSAQTQSAITQAVSGKQDTLVSGTNIKTINNESILGSGNITIQGGGGSSYTAGDGIDITNDVISVTGKADTSAVTAIQDSLSGYVTTDTEQIISGRKIFTYSTKSDKAIEFKQTSDSSKVGFRIINSAATNNELASFELRPNTFTVNGVQHPLMYFGHYRTSNIANAGVPQTVIGFRQYDQLNAAAYHYLIPLPEKAKTPFNLTKSFKDYYAPMGFKNGSTMITADDTGVVDLSSEFGGLKLVKLTQAEYDNLSTKDSNTLYVIVN